MAAKSWSGSPANFMSLPPSLYDGLAVHPGFVVAGDQAGELEGAGLAEAPDDLARAARRKTLPVRVVMLHVGVLPHLNLVLRVALGRVEYELVIDLAGVLEREADLLAPLRLDPVRR